MKFKSIVTIILIWCTMPPQLAVAQDASTANDRAFHAALVEEVVRSICSTLNITSLDQLDKVLNAQLSKTICEKIDKAITQISRTVIDRSATVIDRLGKTVCDKSATVIDQLGKTVSDRSATVVDPVGQNCRGQVTNSH